MPQTSQLIDTLKAVLKAHKMTYADVAAHLDLSEGSVKRLFADQTFSLERFEQICQLMNLEISDLVQLMQENSASLSRLTHEQEKQIVSDHILLLVTVCVLNRWDTEDILQHYNITRTDLIHQLATLDKMKVIDLLPGDKIKLLTSSNFHWIPNGPIQQFFQEKVVPDIFSSRFDRQTETLLVTNVMITKKTNAVIQQKLERLLLEVEQLNKADAGLSIKERQGATLVMALREWNYGVFADLRKRK